MPSDGFAPVRLHGKVFAAFEMNASTVAVKAAPPSNKRMTATGASVVDLTPRPIKEWAIQTLGSPDKLFVACCARGDRDDRAIAGSPETQRRPIGSAVIVETRDAGSHWPNTL